MWLSGIIDGGQASAFGGSEEAIRQYEPDVEELFLGGISVP